MEKTLVCMFTLFTRESIIRVISEDSIEEEIKATLTSLPETISSLCEQKGIKKVSLFGSAIYGEELAKKINENYLTKFSNSEELSITINS